MTGPFPDFDPFLETRGGWPDLHATFLTTFRETLADHLPGDYEARLEEGISLVDREHVAGLLMRTDFAVIRSGGDGSRCWRPQPPRSRSPRPFARSSTRRTANST